MNRQNHQNICQHFKLINKTEEKSSEWRHKYVSETEASYGALQ